MKRKPSQLKTNLSPLESELFEAVRKEEILDIIDLIRGGVDANCKNNDNLTPLMKASIDGNIMSICALKEAGANFNERNVNGDTALMIAARLNRKNPDVMNALMDGSGNAFLTQGAPHILQLATIANNSSIIEILLNRGVDVNSVGNDRIAPIFHAIRCRNASAQSILLKRGASVNVRNQDGLSPILYAIKDDDLKGIKALLETQDNRIQNTEYDTNAIKNNRDYELLKFALKHNPKAITVLMRHGTSIFSTSTNPNLEKKETAIDLIIKDSIANSENDKKGAIEIVSMVIKESLMHFSKNPKVQLKKWRHYILPHLHEENVQELLNIDAINYLKESYLEINLINKIMNEFNARNELQSIIVDSDKCNDVEPVTSIEETISKEKSDDAFMPRKRIRSGGFDETFTLTPTPSPSLNSRSNEESKKPGSTLKRTSIVGKDF